MVWGQSKGIGDTEEEQAILTTGKTLVPSNLYPLPRPDHLNELIEDGSSKGKDPVKVKGVAEWPVPMKKKEAQLFSDVIYGIM